MAHHRLLYNNLSCVFGRQNSKFDQQLQSVSGGDICMCSSSQVLCHGHVRSCVIHNFFPLYGGDVIHACCTKKAECQ